MNRRVTSFLLGLNLLLAAGLALLWFSPLRSTQWQPPAAHAPNLDDARAAVLRSRPDVAAEFSQIAERPLFSSTRRPLPPQAATNAEPAPPPPVALDKLKMFGTINGPTMRGILAEVEGKSSFIRAGEKVGEWTLRRIQSGQAVFEKGDEQREIPLPLAYAAPPAAAPNTRFAKPPPRPRQRAAPPSRPAAAPANRSAPAPVAPPASATDAEKPAIRGSWGP